MMNKRGGRVQVNMMQYQELVNRVDALEKILFDKQLETVREESELTKGEIKEILMKRDVPFTTKNTKEELLGLLEGV